MLKPIEERIKEYIDDFYEDDKDLVTMTKFQELSIKDDTTIDSLEYKTICASIFNLLKNTNLIDKYRIEIDKSCTSLIQKLFSTYVDKDTFIITSSHDHEATTSLITDAHKKYIVNLFDIQEIEGKLKVFNEIIESFKKSRCTKIFCIMVGTAPQAAITVDQSFFKELKHVFIKNNIPHIMVLDDCQGIFMIERNYEIFDAFLATGHVLSCLFSNIGFLFTKLNKKLGYINKQTLNTLWDKLQIINKYKYKAIQFNSLMQEYFNENEIAFKQYKNEAPHQFALNLYNTISNEKYHARFVQYGIRFNPVQNEGNFVRLRYHEAIIQDSNNFLNGLKALKTHLNKLARFKEFNDKKLGYSNEEIYKAYEFTDLMQTVKINPKLKTLLSANSYQQIQERFFNFYKKTLSR